MIKVKKIISYILAIILVILTSATFLLIALNITILSKANIKKQLQNIDYYTKMYNIISDITDNYIVQSGFDKTILNNVLTKEYIEKDVNNLVDSIYDGTEIKISKSEMRQHLDENIENFITQNNYEIDEKVKSDIQKFEDTIELTYENNILYSKNTIEKISKNFNKITRISIIALIILAILSAIIAIIIYKINKPTLGISILSTGVVFIFARFYSTLNVAVNNILILNRAFSDLGIAIINQVIKHIFIYGIILVIIGILLIILLERKAIKSEVQAKSTKNSKLYLSE